VKELLIFILLVGLGALIYQYKQQGDALVKAQADEADLTQQVQTLQQQNAALQVKTRQFTGFGEAPAPSRLQTDHLRELGSNPLDQAPH
jgi:cell division protein FtsB